MTADQTEALPVARSRVRSSVPCLHTAAFLSRCIGTRTDCLHAWMAASFASVHGNMLTDTELWRQCSRADGGPIGCTRLRVVWRQVTTGERSRLKGLHRTSVG